MARDSFRLILILEMSRVREYTTLFIYFEKENGTFVKRTYCKVTITGTFEGKLQSKPSLSGNTPVLEERQRKM